ncbi:hypothetical protein GCM10009802_15840 [Streptomyces synnematoformans]|uniref:Uncharacterized protein n=1 Tax=Streptomyces synnematoformans TaxID=415721 RepID=A0ABP5JBX1_9ACTN
MYRIVPPWEKVLWQGHVQAVHVATSSSPVIDPLHAGAVLSPGLTIGDRVAGTETLAPGPLDSCRIRALGMPGAAWFALPSAAGLTLMRPKPAWWSGLLGASMGGRGRRGGPAQREIRRERRCSRVAGRAASSWGKRVPTVPGRCEMRYFRDVNTGPWGRAP